MRRLKGICCASAEAALQPRQRWRSSKRPSPTPARNWKSIFRSDNCEKRGKIDGEGGVSGPLYRQPTPPPSLPGVLAGSLITFARLHLKKWTDKPQVMAVPPPAGDTPTAPRREACQWTRTRDDVLSQSVRDHSVTSSTLVINTGGPPRVRARPPVLHRGHP